MAVPTGVGHLPQTVCGGQNAIGNASLTDPQLLQGVTRRGEETSARGGTGGGTGPVGEPMARGLNRLTARFVATTTEEGKHSDGGGLYLLVRRRSEQIERIWLFRYKRGGRDKSKETSVSLGPSRDISLATARDLARACREALAKGEDPKAAVGKLTSRAPTFGKVADEFMDSLFPSFRNDKTAADWRRTLGDAYCAALRKRPVDEITTTDVLDVLKPIWLSKPESASRTRERIERVLDAAKAGGLRHGENPARWKNHLKYMLPPQTAKRGHHRALPYPQMPEFMPRLRDLDSISALALEWTILTCARKGETIGTPRSEIDRANKVWIVPAHRMKENREHRVPLTDRCIEIFDEMEKFGSEWLFPARDPREHMNSDCMTACLRRLKVDATVHGFRSTFRDWAGDETSFPREIAEAALSHLIGDKAEQAYRRSDALERRRKLMDAWERYCFGRMTGNVVPMKRA
jgi:integrase